MTVNEIRCIFCEIESNDVVIEENGYKGKKCPQCGLIYISPRPTFDEIADLYGHDNAHVPAESHVSPDYFKRLSARHHLRIIRSVIKSGALLEIGAGGGYFLDEACKIGFNPFGLEPNPIQANFIRRDLYIPCENSPLTKSTFEGRKFDVVYHCDVISHLFDPIADFTKMNEIMKDVSFLIFETGNLGEVDQVYFKSIKCFQYPDHLFFFSTDNLRNLLDRTGFEVLKTYRYSILPESIFREILARVRNLSFKSDRHRKDSDERTQEAAGVIQQSARRSKTKAILNIVSAYFVYFFRYKIGYIAPKRRRPQTVIIVAQKKKAE